ncbi:MAG: hypothetical protein HYZ81_09140 [Nitrospinae bacterium]|nr:hypothetical protein [Nitrospinota bacterium]
MAMLRAYGFPPPNFFLSRGREDLTQDIGRWKAGVPELEGIDIHFDDDADLM